MNLALVILTASCFLCLLKFFRSSTNADRFLAVVILTLLVVGFLGVVAVKTDSEFLVDMAIDVVILAFVGTLAVSKYLLGKELDE